MLTNDESLSAEEKIKQLVEFEEEKHRELDEKREELEEKKKELELLEKQGRKEIEDARKEIEEKIEELAIEEKQRFEELEELHRRREAEAATLEETIAEEEREGRAEAVPEQRSYTEAIEAVMRGSSTFYELTNYNVYNRLRSIERELRESGVISPENRALVDNIEANIQRMQGSEFYSGMDANNYMERIDTITRSIRKRDRDIRGDYQP